MKFLRLVILIPTFLLGGCLSTNLPTDGKDATLNAKNAAANAWHAVENKMLNIGVQVLGNVAVSSLTSKMDPAEADMVHEAAATLWANASQITSASQVQSLVNTNTSGTITPLAAQAAQVFASNPSSNKAKVISAIAGVLSANASVVQSTPTSP